MSESESEGIANYLNNLDGVKISLILKETEDGKIKGSFRTTRDDTDVSALAKKLGGGGHKKRPALPPPVQLKKCWQNFDGEVNGWYN